MKIIIIIVCTLFLCLSSLGIFAQDPFEGKYQVHRIQNPPKIDGVLDSNIYPDSSIKSFVPKLCVPFLSQATKCSMVSDEKNLYIWVQASVESFDAIETKVKPHDDPQVFGEEVIEFLFYCEGANVYYHIAFNLNGSVYDAMTRIDRGEVDTTWNSNLQFAIAKKSGLNNSILLEISLPFKSLNIKPNMTNLRFNITRSQKSIIPIEPIKKEKSKGIAPKVISQSDEKEEESSKDKKAKKNVTKDETIKTRTIVKESSFFEVGENNHVYSAFGHAVLFPNELPKPDHRKQMLDGYASHIASIDVYYKATNDFKGLIPEGCEVGHGATLRHHDHIPVSQWTVKMDGYFRTYVATKCPEYLSLSLQILAKIQKLLDSTQDAEGRSWLPYWNLVDWNGKAHGYDQGPDNTRYRMAIPYEQSKAKFANTSNKFIDSFGYGFYQTSLFKDEVPSDFKTSIKFVLRKLIEMYHREYLLFDKNDKYYWRTTDFTPLKPEPFEDKYTTWLLGSDIVYLMLAYLNFEFNDDTSKFCIESLKKFSDFYIPLRRDLGQKSYSNSSWVDKPLWRIEYLDIRLINLLEYASKNKLTQFDNLKSFINNELKNLYLYDQKVLFAEDGALDWSEATTPLLPVYAYINKEKFRELLKAFVFGAITPRGALPKGVLIMGMNSSSYPLFLSYAYQAWQNKIITDLELSYINNKLYSFFGSQECLRNETDWVNELLPIDKKLPHWRASPDENYVSNVMPEGMWQNNEAQGYLLNWAVYLAGSKTQPFYESGLNRILRNDYIQFAAPFQSHAEPYAYGEAFTFNTLKLQSHKQTEKYIEAIFEKPFLPDDLACFGVFDVTDIYYQGKNLTRPTELTVTSVTCNNLTLPFKIIGCPEFDKVFSEKDNKKVVFLLPSNPSGTVKIEIHFAKTQKYLLGVANE